MSIKTFRSIARFLMPLVGVGGFLLYWDIQEQSHVEAAPPKQVSSRLFQHLQPQPSYTVSVATESDPIAGDRPLLIWAANASIEPIPEEAQKQDSVIQETPSDPPEKAPPLPEPPPLGSTDILFQITGTLEDGDEMLASDQSFYDEHAFEGRAGQPVIITLESEDFDTYLILVGPDQRLLNENDDVSDANSDSSLTTILPTSGTYLAIANSFDSSGRGTYTLTVRAIVSSSRALKEKGQ
jgi:hypothetical protein